MFYGHENEFKTIDDLKKAIEEYIKWYNEERINVKRKGLSLNWGLSSGHTKVKNN